MWPELWTIPIINYPIKGYGLMLIIAFFSGTYFSARRAAKVRADPDMVLNCAILAIIGSVIGARLFYVIHYWDTRFAHLPNPFLAIVDISAGGMEFYGGLAGAIMLILGYLIIKRQSIRLYFDIMTPGLMLGLGITRVGCFLNGCCWGAVCTGTVAEHWSVRFPYGSPAYYSQYADRALQVPPDLLHANAAGRLVPLSRDDQELKSGPLVEVAARHRSLPVHPAQLYATINALLGALFLSWVFRIRKRHGMVFAVWLLTYPWTRIVLENIRTDNPLDTFGLTVSSAVSIGMLVIGLILAIWFTRLPLLSPHAEPVKALPPRPKRRPRRAVKP